LRVAGEFLHACLVAEDRAAVLRARRVNRQYRDLVALLDDVQAEGFDE
jgi:hypothetical protein